MLFNAIIEKDEFGYFSQIPELKGCVSQGKTYDEALVTIQRILSFRAQRGILS